MKDEKFLTRVGREFAELFRKPTLVFWNSVAVFLMVIILPQGIIATLEKLGWSIDRKTALILLMVVASLFAWRLTRLLDNQFRRIKSQLVSSGYFVDAQRPSTRFFNSLSLLFWDTNEYWIVPSDQDSPLIMIRDDSEVVLGFYNLDCPNLLVVRKSVPDSIEEDEWADLSSLERALLFYKFFPKDAEESMKEFFCSIADVVFFYKLEIRDGTLNIVFELSSNFDMPEHAEYFYDLVTQVGSRVFEFRARTVMNLNSS
ncbi:hypothetical protein [Marinobacter sediminicola]|uniref:hypothetical protein n=1 Tax=Marinobacter sediminicola TaxID=3072994 RepID=UPI0028121073|nr:hypothetical protein [Marinobacter sp. F26243]